MRTEKKSSEFESCHPPSGGVDVNAQAFTRWSLCVLYKDRTMRVTSKQPGNRESHQNKQSTMRVQTGEVCWNQIYIFQIVL